MPLEKEVKLRINSPDIATKLAERITDRGGKYHSVVVEVNEFFDLNNRYGKRKEALRLRTYQYGKSGGLFTHKSKRKLVDGVKLCDETEIHIPDPKRFRSMLLKMGYKPVLKYNKRRLTYLLDGCKIEFDYIKGLGRFCEIEGPSVKRINEVRRKISADKIEVVNNGYYSMLLKKRSKK